MKQKISDTIIDRIVKIYIISFYYFLKFPLKEKIKNILKYNEGSINLPEGEQEEQALPGSQKYLKTGYYKYMLGRYLYSLPHIRNKVVLDSGCGLGWGSYLICGYPEKLISIDIDAGSLDFAEKTWKDDKLEFIKSSALDMDRLNRKFDVILGFEMIEHLAYSEGKVYLEKTSANLREKGKLILSSYFPRTEEQARKAEKGNKYHRHIYTREEMKNILKKNGFSKIQFIGSLMLITSK
ncbi:MAG: methyltransferase domain-containing protein [Candidatus Omnitrophota bacterium]|nr:methyltransferase domain-containing protein [Candidatus Omnitrophota bacterium]